MAAESKRVPMTTKLPMAGTGVTAVALGGWTIAGALAHLVEHQTLEERWARLKTRLGIRDVPGVVHEKDPRWCSIDCMAHAMFQRNSEANRARVRARTSNLFYGLLGKKHKLLLIAYENGGRGRIQAFKLFNPRLQSDRDHLHVKWEKMKRRLDLAEEHIEAVARLRDGHEPARATDDDEDDE
jgi:hypothetical protein